MEKPCRACKSELNLALQTVRIMRQQLATLEKMLEHCNSMKEIHSAAESHHGLQGEFKDSLQPAKVLLSALLKLRHKPFTSNMFRN